MNKQLHQLAVKPLYRNISLDLGSQRDYNLTALLSPSNPGLKHIRQLRLYFANVQDRCNQRLLQANLATRMLIEFLPEDVLEEFSWCPWEPFPADSLLLLYKKQKRMKWLEVLDMDRDVFPDLKRNPKLQSSVFANARKLALYPENTRTLELAGFLVEKMSDMLEELIVHCSFDPPNRNSRDPSPTRPLSNGLDARELNDSATGPGLLTRTIFAHKLPFDKCTPFPKLKSLRLNRVNLRYCANTWCRLISFHGLERLRLYYCPGVDSLLGELTRAAHLPKQLKTLALQHNDNTENECLLALDGFLCLVSGLKDLAIDLKDVKTLPAAAGVSRHGKTLEMLNIHASQDAITSVTMTAATNLNTDTEELVYSIDDFSRICKSCTRLEELSCAWPHVSLIRARNPEWKAWENALGHLRQIVTLHISSLPGSWESPGSRTGVANLPRSMYECLLQNLATSMFEVACTSTCPDRSTHAVGGDDQDDGTDPARVRDTATGSPKLRLLAFGIAEKIYEREDSRNQLIYVRSTCQDALGQAQIYAAPIGWCMRQFVEPRSAVLDFIMHRETTVPCRETAPGSRIVRGGWGDEVDDFEVIA